MRVSIWSILRTATETLAPPRFHSANRRLKLAANSERPESFDFSVVRSGYVGLWGVSRGVAESRQYAARDSDSPAAWADFAWKADDNGTQLSPSCR